MVGVDVSDPVADCDGVTGELTLADAVDTALAVTSGVVELLTESLSDCVPVAGCVSEVVDETDAVALCDAGAEAEFAPVAAAELLVTADAVTVGVVVDDAETEKVAVGDGETETLMDDEAVPVPTDDSDMDPL